MSQRLSESAVKGTLHWFTDAERANFEKGRHGLLSVPMGVRPDGRLIYPIAGASPDDPSNDEGGAGGSGDGGAGGGSEGQDDKGDGGGAGDGADGKGTETISKAEYDKLMARMQAADRSKSEVEKKLRELEEKDLSEQEKVLKRVPELEQTVQNLTEENKGLKAKVAFLGLSDFSWHDSDVALAQVDLSEVTAEDGSIDRKALKKAAEALSKDKPFLVKSANDSGKDDGKGGDGKGSGSGQGSSGAGVGSGGKGGSGNGVDEAALKAKYPALNV